jgi:hypothetical protein
MLRGMKLALGIASALAVCTAACKKDEPKKAEPAPAREEAKTAPSPVLPAPAERPAPAEPRPSGTIAGLGGKVGDLLGDRTDTRFPPPAPKGGDCDAVADRVMLMVDAYIAAEMKQLSPEEQAMAKSVMSADVAGVRGQLVTMCRDEQWSQELRDCTLTATSVAELDGCERHAPAGAAATAEAAPPPAWTGGDSCKDVGLRLTQLAMVSMGEVDPAIKAEMEQALAESARQMEEACTTGNWNAEVRACMVAAATIDDVTPCFEKLGM